MIKLEMNKYSVKTFESVCLSNLELEINKWLYKKRDIKIANVSHSSYKLGYSIYYSAIILYEKEKNSLISNYYKYKGE